MASERSIRGPTVWTLIAIAHVAAATYAWRMLPRGFAVGHSRFWINEVLPIALVVVSATCVVALLRTIAAAIGRTAMI